MVSVNNAGIQESTWISWHYASDEGRAIHAINRNKFQAPKTFYHQQIASRLAIIPMIFWRVVSLVIIPIVLPLLFVIDLVSLGSFSKEDGAKIYLMLLVSSLHSLAFLITSVFRIIFNSLPKVSYASGFSLGRLIKDDNSSYAFNILEMHKDYIKRTPNLGSELLWVALGKYVKKGKRDGDLEGIIRFLAPLTDRLPEILEFQKWHSRDLNREAVRLKTLNTGKKEPIANPCLSFIRDLHISLTTDLLKASMSTQPGWTDGVNAIVASFAHLENSLDILLFEDLSTLTETEQKKAQEIIQKHWRNLNPHMRDAIIGFLQRLSLDLVSEGFQCRENADLRIRIEGTHQRLIAIRDTIISIESELNAGRPPRAAAFQSLAKDPFRVADGPFKIEYLT